MFEGQEMQDDLYINICKLSKQNLGDISLKAKSLNLRTNSFQSYQFSCEDITKQFKDYKITQDLSMN